MRNSAWVVSFLLLWCACGGSGGGGPQSGSETWSGQLTGSALGAFICLSGTDGSYSESSQVSLTAPSPGLVSLMDTAQNPATLNGTVSNTETAHEASGIGCAPAPSVVNSTTPPTTVTFTALQNQLTVVANSVLIPAHFVYSNTRSDALNSSRLILNPTQIAPSSISGNWQAVASSSSSAVVLSGTFTLTRTSGGTPPPPVDVLATAGNGSVAVSWSASSGATSYNLYFAKQSGVTPANYTTLAGGTRMMSVISPATVNGLTNGTRYYFVVTAVGASGESGPSTEITAVPSSSGSADEVFISDQVTPAIRVFSRTASGSASPLRSISGNTTTLSYPTALSVDSTNSEVVVADNTAVRVFALNGSGNVGPLRSFNATSLRVRVDPVNAEIAVSDGTNISFYSRTATGSASPLRTFRAISSGGSLSLYDFVVDAVNNEVLVVTGVSTAAPVQVQAFSRTATGTPSPLRTLSVLPSQATSYAALALDTFNSELWVTVTGQTSGTFVFSRTAIGSPTPIRQIATSGRGLYLDLPNGEVGLLTGAGFSVLSRTTLVTLRGANTSIAAPGAIDLGP